jgi:hypothetical protein
MRLLDGRLPPNLRGGRSNLPETDEGKLLQAALAEVQG